ncbi:hypothetical protein [Roseateles agri]|uniref:hypothetical protein n=1 Tax=Roseateles agri TaxID=3098619 RepID=UPI002A5AFA9D|nr:hypothetical protein [Paucibacter sp. R3-3]
MIAIAMSFSAVSSSEPEPSLCQSLASEAEQVPAGEWAAAAYDPMNTLVNARVSHSAARKLSPIEERLVKDPTLHEEFSVGPEETLDVERLDGTDVYRVDSFQGTANCQYSVFIEAPPGKPSHHLSAPFDADTCTTQYGRFGHAFGQPVFMVGGVFEMTGLARSYKISAWQGHDKAWGPACELKLEFKQTLKLSGSHCSPDAALCKAAARVAPAIADAYGHRGPALDPLAFAQGHKPPAALAKLLGDQWNSGMELPTFGAKTAGTVNPFFTSFSNSQGPAGLALWLDGRWWLGVVGIAGIGWRESTTSLLAVYAVTDDGPVPAASFQVEKLPAGPAQAEWR